LQNSWSEISRIHVRKAWADVLTNGAKYYDEALLNPDFVEVSEEEEEPEKETSEYIE
jgi:hypothetical protein